MHLKNSKVCIITRSPSFLFKGLATKHTTVKWTIKNDLKARIMKIAWFSKSPIDSYSEKSSHHHFPRVGRWTLLPCGDFARLFLNMDFTTIKRGLDCCLKIKWHCRILKKQKKMWTFASKPVFLQGNRKYQSKQCCILTVWFFKFCATTFWTIPLAMSRRWYLVCIFITTPMAAISALWAPRHNLIADDLKACN